MKSTIEALCVAGAIIGIAIASKNFGLGDTGGTILTMSLIGAYLGTVRGRRSICGC